MGEVINSINFLENSRQDVTLGYVPILEGRELIIIATRKILREPLIKKVQESVDELKAEGFFLHTSRSENVRTLSRSRGEEEYDAKSLALKMNFSYARFSPQINCI